MRSEMLTNGFRRVEVHRIDGPLVTGQLVGDATRSHFPNVEEPIAGPA